PPAVVAQDGEDRNLRVGGPDRHDTLPRGPRPGGTRHGDLPVRTLDDGHVALPGRPAAVPGPVRPDEGATGADGGTSVRLPGVLDELVGRPGRVQVDLHPPGVGGPTLDEEGLPAHLLDLPADLDLDAPG